jgi:hypothetical protein
MRELTQEEVDQVSAGPTPHTPIVAVLTIPHAAASGVPTYQPFADATPFQPTPLREGKLS